MRDVLERHLQQLFARVADDGAEPVVDPQPTAVGPDVGDADCRLLERGAVDLLALAQGLIRTSPGEGVREDLCDEVQPRDQRVRPSRARPATC